MCIAMYIDQSRYSDLLKPNLCMELMLLAMMTGRPLPEAPMCCFSIFVLVILAGIEKERERELLMNILYILQVS